MTGNSALPPDMQERINQYAREQSRYYLDRAEMTYWEKIQDKADRTRRKLSRKLDRLKLQSVQSAESQVDLSAYITDYINDLVSQGLELEMAFQQAIRELAYDSGSSDALELSEYYAAIFGNLHGKEWPEDSALYGFVGSGYGLYYSGGVIIGCILGALFGFVTGLIFFSSWFWLTAIIGFFAGAVFGVGCAMLLHARALQKRR
ncbi:MAG: hypothetical protein LBU61_04885 [Coriobacteriales bacterium]|jgi:hypothetical protein|nr:hypothetical protein [Coriobacteriales bacterium]